MSIIVLNGSPRGKGSVARLLKAVIEGAGWSADEVEWFDLGEMHMAPCQACMACRPDGMCVLPEDDAHRIGRLMSQAQAIVVGTPTHWGNMSALLKVLLDRNVPVLIGEKPGGVPQPRLKGRPVALATACSAPWPWNFILPESRGALRSVRHVLGAAGCRIVGQVVAAGTREDRGPADKVLGCARRLGARLRTRAGG